MTTSDRLRRELGRIDGRGYKAYQSLDGPFRFSDFTLFIDHVQADPFAAPSKLRLRVPANAAGFPPALFENSVRRVALEDFLARAVRSALPPGSRRGSGRSGVVSIDAGGQEVLERSAVRVTHDFIEARVEVGLPAAGRTVLGREAQRILLEEIPGIVDRSLRWSSVDGEEAAAFVDTVENHAHLKRRLEERRLVAFVPDGAVLPRASGASESPLEGAIRFRSPEALSVELSLLHPRNGEGVISGMGVPEGVTLIAGGGYHGKSTLLRALARGVYPHVPGDGREYVVARSDAVKIRAENGRRVSAVDISSFLRDLPVAGSTECFSSDDASGSTSQAASIIEALEAGARVLLLDEDTSATNFLFRDARMQSLVAREDEPIVPFVDRVIELHERLGISTVIVMGSSGDYFDCADTVLRMRRFQPEEVTVDAKRIAASRPTGRSREGGAPLRRARARRPAAGTIDPSRRGKAVRIEARGREQLLFGDETVDVRALEQLVDASQTRAVGFALYLAARRRFTARTTLSEALDEIESSFELESLDVLSPFGRPGEHPGAFARPRRFEIASALNRLRSATMEQVE